MSRMKSFFAVLVLAAVSGLVPKASAQGANIKVLMSGASGAWQAMALGTYKGGKCPTGSTGFCGHASFGKVGSTNTRFSLIDSRPTSGTLGGTAATDTGDTWIVWNDPGGSADGCSTATCNVWAYVKVDSIVGDRCYFANPRCTVKSPSTFPTSPTQVIATNIWKAEQEPPAPVQSLFTTGQVVQAAVSEIRPEDAQFGQCRINSDLGGGSDGLDGLGYDSAPPNNNLSGTCPAFGASLGQLDPPALTSGTPTVPASTATAHPLAFNISGTDPFTNNAIPAYTTVQVGAYPLIFITQRLGALAGVTDASLTQLQSAFSGNNCLGNNFAGGAATNISVYIREPLSGTMNTAEYSAFRLPRNAAGNYDGTSQETGVASANPVSALGCTSGGKRWSVIGTGEEVAAVQNSNANTGQDGIGYTFFSYGNVSSIASNPNYRYLTVNGIDPIFQLYGTTYDPGQTGLATGELPGTANLPAACKGAFPCGEGAIWTGHLSYPNLRNGSYRQWAMVRLYADTGSTALTAAKALVASAQASSVAVVPDFVSAAPVASPADPGLQLLHSHYTQINPVVVTPNNATDLGGEEGGCIVPKTSVATKLVQREVGCVAGK